MKSSAKLTAWINDRIANESPGFCFPTVEKLAGSFGAAPVTVNRVLKKFSDQGLLERIPGKGTFIPDNTPADNPGKALQPISSVQSIIDIILRSIASGELKKGDPLPQVTFMNLKFKVAANTVSKAYRELEKNGHIIRVGKSFWVGSFKDNIVLKSNRNVYLFTHGTSIFGDFFRSNMRYAYQKLERELNAHGFKVHYAPSADMDRLFRGWIRDNNPPAGIVLTSLFRDSGEPAVHKLARNIDRLGNERPSVLFDSSSLRIRKDLIHTDCSILARGHITTASTRALIDYTAENQFRNITIFMDSGTDSWVVKGRDFALFRFAWEHFDRRGSADLRFVLTPAENRRGFIRHTRRTIIPGRINGNARRKMNAEEENYARRTADRTVITVDFGRWYRKLYVPDSLWIFNSDAEAARALEWARKNGISVPAKLSVIGLERRSEYFPLGLSTCAPDWETIGYQMAHALLGDMPVAKTDKGFIRTRADMFAKQTSR